MSTMVATVEYYLVFVELTYFSSMVPSMPKRDIVSMNFDDTTLGEYPKHWRVLTCYIHG